MTMLFFLALSCGLLVTNVFTQSDAPSSTPSTTSDSATAANTTLDTPASPADSNSPSPSVISGSTPPSKEGEKACGTYYIQRGTYAFDISVEANGTVIVNYTANGTPKSHVTSDSYRFNDTIHIKDLSPCTKVENIAVSQGNFTCTGQTNITTKDIENVDVTTDVLSRDGGTVQLNINIPKKARKHLNITCDLNCTMNGTVINITGLTKCKKNNVRITLSSMCGNFSTNHVTAIDALPDMTLDVLDSNVTNTSITLEWNATITQENCSVTYRYNCEERGSNSHYKNKITDELFGRVEGLSPYTDYTCIVSAFFENILIINTTTNESTDVGNPGQPMNLKHSLSGKNITIEWTEPTEKNGPIDGYRVYCLTSRYLYEHYRQYMNTPTQITADTETPQNRTYICADLKSYTEYTIIVKAYNIKNGEKLEGLPAKETIRTEASKPGDVQNIKQVLPSNNAITITCEKPKETNGPREYFILTLNGIKQDNKSECNFDAQNLNYLATYNFAVSFHNGLFHGDPSPVTVHTKYNDKALIGFLAFLIIVTSIALLIVLYKIYLLQKRSSGHSDESLELIDRDDDKQLLNVDPIPAERLLEAYKSKIADEGRLFLAEFQSIPRVFSKYSVKEARKPYNQNKNRYVDILPYDCNRVQLSQVSGEPGSDYINASHIDGFKEPRKYIAAQGPKDETTDDFWKMIWEQKATIIVMVTRCEEGNRNKCAEYWPTMEKVKETFGDTVVTISEEKRCPDYIIRKLHVTNKKEKAPEREVTHIQFISWPDHGVPDDPHLLLKLRRRVNAFSNFFSGPIVVHCSAGVGRTGTYIGIDAMMECLEAEGRVDVYGYVVKLRRQRCLMVQVEAQYILIHQALLEHNQFGETEVPLSELHSHLASMLKHDPPTDPSLLESEFQRLPTYKNWRAQSTGNQKENESKNRYPNVLPYDYNRVPIKINDEKSKESENDNDSEDSSDDDSDSEDCTKYINASYINGYWGPRAIIAAQGPLKETTADFWQMVFQRRTKAIVMLTECTEGEQDFCAQYWDDEKRTYDDIEVDISDCNKASGYTIRVFEIRHIKRKETRKVYQYQFHKWSGKDLPDDPEDLVAMIRSIKHKLPKKSISEDSLYDKSVPVVIHCNDGSKRTGTFCALWNLLDCADIEGVVDVFQTVKALRRERAGVMASFEHYKFLYEVIAKTYPAQNGEVKSVANPEPTTLQIINEKDKREAQDTTVHKSPDSVTPPDPGENKVAATTEEEKSEAKSSANTKTETGESPANGPTPKSESQ